MDRLNAAKLECNIYTLYKMNVEGSIDFDIPVQRGLVWDNKRKSDLIHSILLGLRIGEFILNKIESKYEGIEGKQRNRAICDYRSNEFALHAKTPDIVIGGVKYQIAKKSYNQLTEEVQNEFDKYNLNVHYHEDLEMEDKILVFERTNRGKPVTASDIARVRVKSRGDFMVLAEHKSLQFAISDTYKKKCWDEDIVEDIWILANCENKNLRNENRNPILSNTEITQEQKSELSEAFDYLLPFYREMEKNKKLWRKCRAKTHMVMVGYMAVMAHRQQMSAEDFVKRAIQFFIPDGTVVTVSESYNDASRDAAANEDHVRMRMEAVEEALRADIDEEKSVVVPTKKAVSKSPRKTKKVLVLNS